MWYIYMVYISDNHHTIVCVYELCFSFSSFLLNPLFNTWLATPASRNLLWQPVEISITARRRGLYTVQPCGRATQWTMISWSKKHFLINLYVPWVYHIQMDNISGVSWLGKLNFHLVGIINYNVHKLTRSRLFIYNSMICYYSTGRSSGCKQI